MGEGAVEDVQAAGRVQQSPGAVACSGSWTREEEGGRRREEEGGRRRKKEEEALARAVRLHEATIRMGAASPPPPPPPPGALTVTKAGDSAACKSLDGVEAVTDDPQRVIAGVSNVSAANRINLRGQRAANAGARRSHMNPVRSSCATSHGLLKAASFKLRPSCVTCRLRLHNEGLSQCWLRVHNRMKLKRGCVSPVAV